MEQKKKKRYEKKRQQCALCTNSYSKREYLAKHMTKEHGEVLQKKAPGRKCAFRAGDLSDPRPYKCPDCIKEYRRSKHLARHRSEVHEQKVCADCNEPVRNMARHMAAKHGAQLPRNFQCSTCKKHFLTSGHLQTHTMRVHQVADRKFECSVCAKTFSYSNDLRKHMRTHSMSRSILCDICGEAFKSSDTLKIHMRRHTGERPYKCTTCDKAFSSCNSLYIHRRTHSGERPYTCQYCGKGFSDASTLTVHKRLHTNENPFICHLCGKTTKQASNLRSHYKHRHKNDVISGRQIRLNSRVFARYAQQEIDMHLQMSGNLMVLLQSGLHALQQEESDKKRDLENAMNGTVPPPPTGAVPEASRPTDRTAAVRESQPSESDESEDFDDMWQDELGDRVAEPVSEPVAELESPVRPKLETGAKLPAQMQSKAESPERAATRSSGRIAAKSTCAITKPTKTEPIARKTKSNDRRQLSPQIESVFIENDLSDSPETMHANIKQELAEEPSHEPSEPSAADDDYWTNVYDDDFESVYIKPDQDEHATTDDMADDASVTTEPSGDSANVAIKQDTVDFDDEPSSVVWESDGNTVRPLTEAERKLRAAQPAPDQKLATNYKNTTGTCVQCNRKVNDFTRHQVEMHSALDKPFECFHCRKTYKKLEHLKSHMVVHSNERNFICHFCGQSFFLSSEMRKHIFNRHQDARPYGCNSCKKTFKSKYALKKHSVVHTGVKAFVCAMCSERFAARSSLRIHERRHTGAKPFVCTHCGKAFADSSTHRQHVRIHTGEKPYVCKLCGRACAQAGNLKSHYRHYHKVIVRNVSMFQENDFPVFERLPTSAFDRYGMGTGENRIEE